VAIEEFAVYFRLVLGKPVSREFCHVWDEGIEAK